MQKQLHTLLKENDYIKSVFKLSKTQHLMIKAKINGVEGSFILDTGASHSCIDFESEQYFNLTTKKSNTKVAGAGAIGMPSKTSEHNIVDIGRWRAYQISVILFDLNHVNQTLLQAKLKPIHGIIGADILLEGKSIIDYPNRNIYLKKQDVSKRNLRLF